MRTILFAVLLSWAIPTIGQKIDRPNLVLPIDVSRTVHERGCPTGYGYVFIYPNTSAVNLSHFFDDAYPACASEEFLKQLRKEWKKQVGLE